VSDPIEPEPLVLTEARVILDGEAEFVFMETVAGIHAGMLRLHDIAARICDHLAAGGEVAPETREGLEELARRDQEFRDWVEGVLAAARRSGS